MPDTQPVKPSRGRRPVLLAAGGCGCLALLLVSTLGAVGGWYFFLHTSGTAGLFTSIPEDLRFVHADVAAFVSIRVADFAKNDTIRSRLADLPGPDQKEVRDKLADFEKKLSLAPSEVERITFIFRSNDLKESAVVLRVSKPFHRKKILDALAANRENRKYGKHDYVRLRNDTAPSAFHFVSDQTLIACPNETVLQAFLDQTSKPAKHPAFVRGVKLAAEGKHALVAAAKADAKPLLPSRVKLEPDLQGFVVTGALAQELYVEIACIFTDPAQAERAKPSLEKSAANMKAIADSEPCIEKTTTEVINSLVVEQQRDEVVLKGKAALEVGPWVEAIMGLPVDSRRQLESRENLRLILRAMHRFHDERRGLPNHAILDSQTGEPLLSWRVALLRYLDGHELYREIRLNERWDSPHNKQFWNGMPEVYRLPGRAKDGKTHYQVFHGEKSAFPRATLAQMVKIDKFLERGRHSLVTITDGSSNTVAVVEAASAVNWMAPDDIPYEGEPPALTALGDHWGDSTFHAAMLDGTVRRWRRAIPPAALNAFITPAGAENEFFDDAWDIISVPGARLRDDTGPLLLAITRLEVEPLVESLGYIRFGVTKWQNDSRLHLFTIASAIRGFHDANQRMPNHAIVDVQTGKPLLSWRVSVLPYIDQAPLFGRIRLDEAWDSAHNRQFWNQMPPPYWMPGTPKDGKTYYRVLHGDTTLFPKLTRMPPFNQPAVGDLTSLKVRMRSGANTILVIESSDAGNWMQPDDILFADPPAANLPLGNHWDDDSFQAVMADAQVRRWRRSVPPNVLKSLASAKGDDPVDAKTRKQWEIDPPESRKADRD